MKIVIHYVLLSLLILSCTSRPQETAEMKIEINPTEADRSFDCKELLDTAGCALIPLGDTRKPIVHVSKLQVVDGKIYVMDENTHCLHVFAPDGKALFSIDRQGRAGNEYLALTDFHATRQEIFLLDQDSEKILVCDSLGKFVRKIDIEEYWGNGMFGIGNDIYIVNKQSKPQAGRYHLFRFASDGSFLGKYLPFDRQFGFSSSKYYAPGGCNEYLYCQTPINTVYQVTPEGCAPLLDIDFGSYAVPEKYYTTGLRKLMKDGIHRTYVLGIDQILGNEKYIFLKYTYGKDRDSRWIIYDRQAKRLKAHCDGFITSNMYGIGLSEFTIQGQWVYVIYSGFNFTGRLRYYTPNPPLLPRYQKELEEVGKRVTEASNPVLVRYKFK